MLATQRQELQKIAEGREAEMFAWEEGTILRLLRDPEAQQWNELQVAAIELARSLGVRVPTVYGSKTVMGRPGLIMERIEGTDLLTLIGRRPWTVFRAGRISGEAHAKLHEAKAPETIPDLKGRLRAGIQSVGVLPKQLAEFTLEVLEGLPDGDRLCHGDFHPGNIMMAGATPVLIDWTGAMRGDPAADVARTRLLLRIGEPPPGTSAALRVMSRFGRSILVSLYLRSYRRRRPLDMTDVARWDIPVAAARLGDGIEEETPSLISMLEKAYGRTG